MATIKVFDANGVKELLCFDTLQEVPYIEEEEQIDDTPEENDDTPEEKNPFE